MTNRLRSLLQTLKDMKLILPFMFLASVSYSWTMIIYHDVWLSVTIIASFAFGTLAILEQINHAIIITQEHLNTLNKILSTHEILNEK